EAGVNEKRHAKLAKFSEKVPAAVAEQERQRLADWTAQHDALTVQRARLGGTGAPPGRPSPSTGRALRPSRRTAVPWPLRSRPRARHARGNSAGVGRSR